VALLADITTPGERGILQGVSTAIQLASQVAFLALISLVVGTGSVPAWSYALVAALMVASFGVTVLGVREPAVVDEPTTGQRRLGLGGYLAELVAQRQAMRYLLAIFTFMVGFSAVLPYLTLFITVDIGETEQVALALAAGTLLVTAVAAVVFGKLADRIGNKPVLVAGWALLAVAAFGGTVIQHLPETIAVVLLAGIGNGAATAAGWPLLVSLVPAEKIGVFAGLKAAAESIAIPASVLVAAEIFLPRFSYRGVFVLLAATILIALFILVRHVRPPTSGEAAVPIDDPAVI
jgi:Na+/melibiose symporter-like transporter